MVEGSQPGRQASAGGERVLGGHLDGKNQPPRLSVGGNRPVTALR